MKVIVINAAPRMESGNTQVVLNPFLVGLRHEGAQTEVILLNGKKIERCRGCFTCYAKTPGRCVQDDDMPALMERIRSAEMMVLGTPVYIDGMTALAKTFVDRLVPFMDPHFIEVDGRVLHPLRWKFPKKLFLVSVCGFPGVENFDPLLLHVKRIARNFHAEFAGALLRPSAFSLLLARKYPERVKEVMDAIRSAGEELGREGRISKATLDAVASDICTTKELVDTANAYWDRELERSRDQPA